MANLVQRPLQAFTTTIGRIVNVAKDGTLNAQTLQQRVDTKLQTLIGGFTMSKLIAILIAGLFVTSAFAQTKVVTPAVPATPATPAVPAIPAAPAKSTAAPASDTHKTMDKKDHKHHKSSKAAAKNKAEAAIPSDKSPVKQ